MIHTDSHQKIRGFALIMSLLFLIVLTVLGVAMFSSGGSQNKIAGNTLENYRSKQIAEGALRYGEWLLTQTNLPTFIANCNATPSSPNPAPLVNLSQGGAPYICGTDIQNPTQLPWNTGMTYIPTNLTVKSGGGQAQAQGALPADVNYSNPPSLYIFQMPAGTNGGTYYRITAAGYGGDASTGAVVQSVVSLQ